LNILLQLGARDELGRRGAFELDKLAEMEHVGYHGLVIALPKHKGDEFAHFLHHFIDLGSQLGLAAFISLRA